MRPDAWTTDLLIWEAKLVLESLIREEERLRTIIATSENEDEIADRDEDLIKLRLTLKRLKEEAVARFGPSVLNFDKGAL
jgi:hypothetical protein